MNIVYKGVWFLPESNKSNEEGLIIKDEDMVDGILTISENNEFTLKIIGDFNNITKDEGFVIHGNTTDGKAITLFNCFEQGGHSIVVQ